MNRSIRGPRNEHFQKRINNSASETAKMITLVPPPSRNIQTRNTPRNVECQHLLGVVVTERAAIFGFCFSTKTRLLV